MKKKLNTFNEAYIVKYNIKKKDGFWDIGLEITININIVHGVNEKNNHDFAKSLFEDAMIGEEYKIISVTYV